MSGAHFDRLVKEAVQRNAAKPNGEAHAVRGDNGGRDINERFDQDIAERPRSGSPASMNSSATPARRTSSRGSCRAPGSPSSGVSRMRKIVLDLRRAHACRARLGVPRASG